MQANGAHFYIPCRTSRLSLQQLYETTIPYRRTYSFNISPRPSSCYTISLRVCLVSKVKAPRHIIKTALKRRSATASNDHRSTEGPLRRVRETFHQRLSSATFLANYPMRILFEGVHVPWLAVRVANFPNPDIVFVPSHYWLQLLILSE